MKITKLAIYSAALMVIPFVGLAQGTILSKEPEGGYQICDMLTLINSIVNVVVKGIIPLIATLIIAWAGIRMVTNQGDADIAKQTRTIFVSIAIGLVVMFGSYAIVGSVLAGMGYAKNWSDWSKECKK